MRKKRGSLFYQFSEALSRNFREGTQKHSYKKEYGRTQDKKFFSYSDYYQTVELSKSLAGFIRENYPDIRNAYQVSNTHVSAFLNTKVGTCNLKSLATYTSRLNHLARALEASDPGVREHGGKSWKMPAPKGHTCAQKLRDVWMPPEDRALLEEYLAGVRESASKRAVMIALATGLRVHECVTLTGDGIDINEHVVRGKGKGGRHYKTAIRSEYIEVMSTYKELYGSSIVSPIKGDSANRYLHHCLDMCGIDEVYKEHRTGTHAIRKNVAQDLYESERQKGKTHVEAATAASLNLSHGKYRKDVDDNYIKNKA